jgi:hypothetical protein
VLTDEELGVAVYHEKYFSVDNSLYVDPSMGFYNAFGRKNISSQLTWNPFVILWKIITTPFRYLSVQGNLVGEGSIQGGLLVIQPEGPRLAYHVPEPLESDFNYDEIAFAVSGNNKPSGKSEGTFLDGTDNPSSTNPCEECK